MRTRTIRVGLTGGIGSGKSAVAELWRARGAVIVDSDVIAREVVAPGTDGLREIAAVWPAAIVDGALDRQTLAAIVFRDDAARKRLNAIVHPRVRARSAELEGAAPAGSVAVLVVPLLFEGELWKACDATVLVAAPAESRIERVTARDALVRAEVEARMRAQIDPAVARERATFVIENDADRETLAARANAVYDLLLALP